MSEERNRNLERILILANWDWDSPEEVHEKWIRKDKEAIGPLLEDLYEDCDVEKLKFLYFNYEFLENQIQQFLEADSFAYDKSNWVLKQCFKDLVGECADELEGKWYDPNWIGRKCTEPEFGTTKDWLNFVDAMIEMYNRGMTSKVMAEVKNIRLLQDEYLNR